jgi:hypothetical protein
MGEAPREFRRTILLPKHIAERRGIPPENLRFKWAAIEKRERGYPPRKLRFEYRERDFLENAISSLKGL